jgi:DNA primase
VGGRNLAAEYERRYPDTGVSEAQKEERMERLLFNEDKQALRRTTGTRGIVVPRLPWLERGEAA